MSERDAIRPFSLKPERFRISKDKALDILERYSVPPEQIPWCFSTDGPLKMGLTGQNKAQGL